MPKAVATIPPSKDTRALQAIADIDWTKSGVVTGIRHQGKCSSCYAFATIAVTESMFLIRNKTLSSTSFDLSEQQLVDCGKYINKFIPRNQTGFKLNGCFSGSPTNALKYIQKFGISSETQYPYRAKQAYFCNKNSGSFKITKINYAKGCIDIQTALKTAPVAVVVIC
jgi:cathepsin L